MYYYIIIYYNKLTNYFTLLTNLQPTTYNHSEPLNNSTCVHVRECCRCFNSTVQQQRKRGLVVVFPLTRSISDCKVHFPVQYRVHWSLLHILILWYKVSEWCSQSDSLFRLSQFALPFSPNTSSCYFCTSMLMILLQNRP